MYSINVCYSQLQSKYPWTSSNAFDSFELALIHSDWRWHTDILHADVIKLKSYRTIFILYSPVAQNILQLDHILSQQCMCSESVTVMAHEWSILMHWSRKKVFIVKSSIKRPKRCACSWRLNDEDTENMYSKHIRV